MEKKETKKETVEKSSKEVKEEITKPVDKKEIEEKIEKKTFDKSAWQPKTGVGIKIKSGEFNDIDQIIDMGLGIMEPEIIDALIPGLETDLLLIGQSKGKFGGGQRRVFKQTQKKTQEGNKPKFATIAVVGNTNGYVGIGYGKSKETVPAREKAIRNAKLNIMKIRRGCGSWQCGCKEPHSIPFKVEGKCGSSEIKIMPAPKGTGLRVEKEVKKILGLAGIKDVWSKTRGQTKTKINLIYACVEALKQLTGTKIKPQHIGDLGIVEGKLKKEE